MSEDVKDPEKFIKAFILGEGDIRVGISQSELPGHVLLFVPRAGAALAINLAAANALHDSLCAAISTLDETTEIDGEAKIPIDKAKWN